MTLANIADRLDRAAIETVAIGGGKRVWDDPIPLPDALPAVPPFDPAMLPRELQAWACDIADRMQCPLDFVAIPAIVAAGSLIGRRIGIRPEARTSWTETGNLWGCVVGPPGALKSPAVSEALTPMRRLEAEAAAAHEAELDEWKITKALFKLEQEKGEKTARVELKKGDRAAAKDALTIAEPDEPTPRRYMTTNANEASLGKLCQENPDGVLIHRDELLTMFRDLDRPDNEGYRGFLLTGWNGQESYTFDRIGRGVIRVQAVNLSVLGTTQPTRISAYLADTLRSHDDGMVQRIQLLAWPDFKGKWQSADRYPDAEARQLANACYNRLATLNSDAVGAQRDPYGGIAYLRFADDALAEFAPWRAELEARVRDPDMIGHLRDHLAKYRGLVPRLALICHLAGGGTGPVALEPTMQALTLAGYLEGHAVRAYGSIESANAATARSIWRKIVKGDLAEGFSERDVYRPNWSGLKDKTAVKAGLQLLVERDWLAIENVETGGRPTSHYVINPRARA